jgi:hypothetical protein
MMFTFVEMLMLSLTWGLVGDFQAGFINAVDVCGFPEGFLSFQR